MPYFSVYTEGECTSATQPFIQCIPHQIADITITSGFYHPQKVLGVISLVAISTNEIFYKRLSEMIHNSTEDVKLGSNSKSFYRNVELILKISLRPRCSNRLQGLGRLRLDRHTEETNPVK